MSDTSLPCFVQTPNSSTTVQHMLTSASAYASSAPAIVYGEAQHQHAGLLSFVKC